MPGRSRSQIIQTGTARLKAQSVQHPPGTRSDFGVVLQPEPWWARYVLALLKLLLAFALAVLTLIFTYSGRPPIMPPLPSIDSPHPEIDKDNPADNHDDSDLDKSAP